MRHALERAFVRIFSKKSSEAAQSVVYCKKIGMRFCCAQAQAETMGAERVMNFEIDGLKIEYDLYGEGGRLIVILHGWGLREGDISSGGRTPGEKWLYRSSSRPLRIRSKRGAAAAFFGRRLCRRIHQIYRIFRRAAGVADRALLWRAHHFQAV